MSETSGSPEPVWQRVDKRLLGVIGAVVVVALVVGGVALARRGDAGDDNGTADKNAEATATAGATSTASPGSPVKPAGGASRPAPGATAGGKGSPTASAAGESGTAPERPKAPAAEGSTLTTITAPPDKTLALLDPKKVDAATEWDIEFSPYGFAPSGANSPKRVVIKITGGKQTAGKDTDLDLTGRNMLVLLDMKESVTLGGSYTGHLVLREQGGVLVPILNGVKAQ